MQANSIFFLSFSDFCVKMRRGVLKITEIGGDALYYIGNHPTISTSIQMYIIFLISQNLFVDLCEINVYLQSR